VCKRKSRQQIREERYNLKDLPAGRPRHWEINARSCRDGEYPPGCLRTEGLFATPRESMGVQNQLMMYYDDPQLIYDINQQLENLWLAMVEEIVSRINLDFVHTWEAMAYKNCPLMLPNMLNEFFSPYCIRLTRFLKAHNVNFIFVDSDGDGSKLIPSFLGRKRV
jgi:hypothetical protein